MKNETVIGWLLTLHCPGSGQTIQVFVAVDWKVHCFSCCLQVNITNYWLSCQTRVLIYWYFDFTMWIVKLQVVVYKHVACIFAAMHVRLIVYIHSVSSLSFSFKTPPKTSARNTQLRKNHCSCILEGHLSTNPTLGTLHLQGPKSNIYVHFHWVNKLLTGISLLKWNCQ